MPAAKPKPKAGKTHARYVVEERAKDEALRIDWVGTPPEITVLGVDDVEGTGMGVRVNRWRYVLTWTD